MRAFFRPALGGSLLFLKKTFPQTDCGNVVIEPAACCSLNAATPCSAFRPTAASVFMRSASRASAARGRPSLANERVLASPSLSWSLSCNHCSLSSACRSTSALRYLSAHSGDSRVRRFNDSIKNRTSVGFTLSPYVFVSSHSLSCSSNSRAWAFATTRWLMPQKQPTEETLPRGVAVHRDAARLHCIDASPVKSASHRHGSCNLPEQLTLLVRLAQSRKRGLGSFRKLGVPGCENDGQRRTECARRAGQFEARHSRH